MTAFQASKYDFKNDEHKKGMGDVLNVNGKGYVIMEVDFLTAKDIVLMEGRDIDKRGYDEVISEQHPERPFVYFIYYCNETK